MVPWSQDEELKLLLVIVQQTNPKINWNDVSSKMGRTERAIIQHYDAMRKKNSFSAGTSAGNTPTSTKKRRAKGAHIDSSAATKKANKVFVAGNGGQDDVKEESPVKSMADESDADEETPTKHRPQRVKVEKMEDGE